MDITRYSDPPWARIARIVFGAAFGTTITVFADVQASLSRMHFADASTLPNMAPQIRYLFIPVLLVIALAASIVVDFLIWLVAGRRPLRRSVHYIALGACNSLSLAALPLSGILPRSPYSWLGGPLLALLTAAIVRWRLGSRVVAGAS
jgi:hypothetical protein